MKKRITLRDLAGAAGVHFTTAGLAVRGDPRVSPETAARVLAVAKRLGYRPDPIMSAFCRYRHAKDDLYHGTIGYIMCMPRQQLAYGGKVVLDAVEKHARLLGFRVDCFGLHAGTPDGRTLSRILLARGIRGLILQPLLSPGTFPAMDWGRFSVTAIGYSVREPVFHRVCPHQMHTVWVILRELGALGYRRIGLAITPNADIRTEHNILGAYLSHQHPKPSPELLPPLITDTFDVAEVRPWMAQHRPDCVLASESHWMEKLQAMGFAIPQGLGFSVIAKRPEMPHFAGLDERQEMWGEMAVDFNVSLLAKGEKGIPEFPSTTLIEGGRWSPGTTVRPVNR